MHTRYLPLILEKKMYAICMDLEKAFDKVYRLGFWEILTLCGEHRSFLYALMSFYTGSSACVIVMVHMNECFIIKVEIFQGFEMSQSLFDVLIDGVSYESEMG